MQYAAQAAMAALSSLLSIAVLFLLAKLMGTKQVSQMTMFDYVVGITIGSIAAELATELEEPLRPLTALVIYGVTAFVISVLTNKFLKVRALVTGKPLVLLENGVIYRENLKKARLDLSEFLVLCRQQGYFDLTEIQTAVFEYNGTLSILPVSDRRPATPNDLSLSPSQAMVFTELIMDGRILHDNLKRMGRDLTWLERQLQQHRVEAKDVFLALCDQNGKFVVYKNKTLQD